MLFNSYIFIFLFLPLALIGWHGLNRIKQYKMAQIFLVIMSLWFYAYFNVRYLAIIVASCLVNYFISLLLEKKKDAGKAMLIIGIIFNLGMLGYFKYYDFFITNINALIKSDFNLRHILLPLGISFFTFQQLSFVIDRCKGKASHYEFVDYMTFVTFFPQLIAGPIVLHSEIMPQFKDNSRRTFDRERFEQGLIYFVIGLAKKVLIADLLAKPANFAFESYTGLDSVSLIIGALAYMYELYFDFSGYCDMAVGIGKMFGVDIPQNFNSPYKSASVKEFWRRWHITLGRFFTTYVYIPLGGSRQGKAKTVLNTMIVFVLSGLWHGANWTFVLWGFLHGLGVSFDAIKGKKAESKFGRILGMGLTNLFVLLAWVIFRSDSIKNAFEYIKGIFSFKYYYSIGVVAEQMKMSELYIVEKVLGGHGAGRIAMMYYYLFLLVMAGTTFIMTRKNTKEIVETKRHGVGMALSLAFLLMWAVISLSGVSTFLYFNF